MRPPILHDNSCPERFHIYGYEFHSNIKTYQNVCEGFISIPYKLLEKSTCDVIKEFRTNGDKMTKTISQKYKLTLHFNYPRGRIIVTRSSVLNSYNEVKNALYAVYKEINNIMNYFNHKDKLPHNLKKQSSVEIQKPPHDTNQVFHGLVAVITQPNPEILAKLFESNIQYKLLPELLINNMLLPPPSLMQLPFQPPTSFEDGEIR
jgi:hypothetical protein